MDRPVGELGHAADVIGVHARRYRDDCVAELMLDEVRDRHESERRVDDQVTVALRTCHTLHRSSGWTWGSVMSLRCRR
jgi:hypothetical protein